MSSLSLLWKESVGAERELRKAHHASTLLPLQSGELALAWFQGSAEGARDVGIFTSRRAPAGGWSTPERIDCEPDVAHWNPVLASRTDGTIVLFYKAGNRIADWQTMTSSSADGGKTWSTPVELVPGDRGGRGPVRTKPLVFANGTWIAGASIEQGRRWIAFADISRDEGRTWMKSPAPGLELPCEAGVGEINSSIPVSAQSFSGRGVIQPSLWAASADDVHMLLRSTEGWLFRSDSANGGLTWSSPARTSVPNNNSGIDVLRFDDGTLALAHNPVGVNWGARSPLVVSLSEDGGFRWRRAFTLAEGPGEFSYPALVGCDRGLFASWTEDRRGIAVARLEIRA